MVMEAVKLEPSAIYTVTDLNNIPANPKRDVGGYVIPVLFIIIIIIIIIITTTTTTIIIIIIISIIIIYYLTSPLIGCHML